MYNVHNNIAQNTKGTQLPKYYQLFQNIDFKSMHFLKEIEWPNASM